MSGAGAPKVVFGTAGPVLKFLNALQVANDAINIIAVAAPNGIDMANDERGQAFIFNAAAHALNEKNGAMRTFAIIIETTKRLEVIIKTFEEEDLAQSDESPQQQDQ